jgi:hypothetical protein
MKKNFLVLSILCCFALLARGQTGSPYNNVTVASYTITSAASSAAYQLGNPISGGFQSGSYNMANVTVTGVALSTVTFSILGSSDPACATGTFFALPINAIASPGTTSTSITATTGGIYQFPTGAINCFVISPSGTFTATNVTFKVTVSVNGLIGGTGGGGGGGGGGGAVSSVFSRTGSVTAQTGDYTVSQVTGAAPLASPAFTGTPTAPTQSCASNTDIATGAYVANCAAGSSAFNAITTGTNTTAAMTVGAGATLTYASTGILNANELLGGTWAIPGAIGSTTPAAGYFTSIGVGSSPPTACSAVTGCWAAAEGSTLATAASGVDTMQADSTSHHFIETLNNGAKVYSPVVAALGTSGHVMVFASNGIDISDGGAPSGTGTVTQVVIAGTSGQINTAGTCTITTTGTCTLSFPVADFTVAVSSGTQGANSCSSPFTQSVTNLTTGMVVQLGYSVSPASLTGWGSTGGMVAQGWPSAAGTLSYILCNQTASSISYSAITFNGSAR